MYGINKYSLLFVISIIILNRIESQQWGECNIEICTDEDCDDVNVTFTAPSGGVSFCEGATIPLINTSATDFTYYVIDWTDGNIDTLYIPLGDTIFHTFHVPDSIVCDDDRIGMQVCFKGVLECPTNNTSCAWASFGFTLKVRPKAMLNLESNYCVNRPIPFSELACNEELYLWDFGDGNTSPLANPNHTFTMTGPKNIQLIVTNECGSDTASQTVPIVSNPIPLVSWDLEDDTVCIDQIVELTDITSTYGGATWVFPAIDSSEWALTDTLMNEASNYIAILFKEEGTYHYRLRAMNACSTVYWDQDIVVLDGPAISLPVDQQLCESSASFDPEANFSNEEQIDSLLWLFEGGTPSISEDDNPGIISYSNPGSYTVTLNVFSACGTSYDSLQVNVDALPIISMPFIPATYCSGSSIDTLTATPIGGTWMGPGISSLGNDVYIFDPAQVTPGSTVNLIYHAINGTCDAFDTITTTVVASEIVSTTDIQVCEDNDPFQLTATPTGGTWSGTGVTNPTGTFDPGISGPGMFAPDYSYMDVNGCLVVVNADVTIQAFPQISMPDTSILCNEDIDLLLTESLQLAVNPTGGSYSWIFNGSPVDSTINGFGLTGFYDISLAYTYQACEVADSAVIEFISSTPLVVSGDTVLCIYNGPFMLQSNLSGNWSGPGVNPATGDVDLQLAGGGNHTYVFEHQPGTSCFQSDTVILTIQDPGLALNAGPDISLCFGESSPYTLSAGSPVGGLWQGTGITNPAPGQIDLNILNSDTSYTYSYCIEDASLAGCMACDDISLIVHALPDAGFQIVGTPCEDTPFSLVADSCDTGNDYQWALGDGGTSTLCTVNHTYSNGGDYIIQLQVESAFGCENTSTTSVHVTSPPTASFDLLDDEGCAPFLVQVNNNSAGEINQHSWVIGQDTIIGVNPGIVIIDGLLADSIVAVQLIVENGCASISDFDSILVHPYPVVDFGFNVDEGCSPLLIDFGNATLGNPENWAWDLGNGQTSNDSIPLPQTYTTPPDSVSQYEVQLIATNMCGADTVTQTITVYPPDVTAFIQIDTVIGCQPLTVPAHALATPGSEIGWQVFLNGNQVTGSTDADPVFVLDQPGLHTIVLSAARCGMDFDTAYVEVLPAPFVDFLTDPVLCEETVVQFINHAVNVTNVVWDFGDGNGSQLFEPAYVYADAGTYVVTLSANSTINNCPATISIPVTIHARPILDIDQQPRSGCPPLLTTFTNTGPTDADYVWFFGDSSPLDTAYQPVHVFSSTGQYLAEVFAYNLFGCFSDTVIIPIEVHPEPVSDFSVLNTRFCAMHDTLETSNESEGANSYIWLIDGVEVGAAPPYFPFENPGQFELTLVAENSFSCRDTSDTLLSILPSPVADFSISDSAGCAPFNTAFINSSSFTTHYEWNFGDGNASIDVSPGHIYIDSGNYTVTLVAFHANGCPNDTAKGQVVVFPVPQTAFNFQKADTCGVPMDVQMINQTIGAIDYAWSFGDGNTSDHVSPVNTYIQDGTFVITLVGGNIHGCFDTVTSNVGIYLQPLADFFIPSDKVCERDTLFLENGSLNALEYCWRLDNALYSMDNDLVIVPDSQGVYSITLVAKYNEYCQDSFGLPGGLKVFVTPVADFEYMADPQANILGDVRFTNLSVNYDQLVWDLGDGSQSMEEDPFHEYDINRDIDVTLVATNFNNGALTCIDSITKSIAPEWLVTFYAPTALSPDHGDSLVSVFRPVGIGLAEYTIEVYSPWGQLVWHSDKIVDQMPAESWNGRVDNQDEVLPQGAFTWIARVGFVNGERRVFKGSVTLLR